MDCNHSGRRSYFPLLGSVYPKWVHSFYFHDLSQYVNNHFHFQMEMPGRSYRNPICFGEHLLVSTDNPHFWTFTDIYKGMLAMLLLWPTAVDFCRRRTYEAFLILHILLSTVALVGCF